MLVDELIERLKVMPQKAIVEGFDSYPCEYEIEEVELLSKGVVRIR